MDVNMPLTQVEVGEWGDVVGDAECFERVKGYSPYELLFRLSKEQIKNLPELLILCGEKDSRVPVWQSMKFICMIRRLMNYDNFEDVKYDKNAYPGIEESRSKNKGRVFVLVDKERGHFESVGVVSDGRKGGYFNDFDPYSHKAIRNLFLLNKE
ncbi:Protease 2 [Smittium culicis]|uniref:Prolyl endopeptidase-like n=1 Tax=Smittium culicis TaxID=133412 RepID=A0A1R1Y786_9FUNG|nr:Protease 2 [Smittium culicis]